MDYYGVIQELDEAMDLYASLPDFDEDELSGALTDIADVAASCRRSIRSCWTCSRG